MATPSKPKRHTHKDLNLAIVQHECVEQTHTILALKLEVARLQAAVSHAIAALDTEPEIPDPAVEATGNFERISRRRALRTCMSALFPKL